MLSTGKWVTGSACMVLKKSAASSFENSATPVGISFCALYGSRSVAASGVSGFGTSLNSIVSTVCPGRKNCCASFTTGSMNSQYGWLMQINTRATFFGVYSMFCATPWYCRYPITVLRSSTLYVPSFADIRKVCRLRRWLIAMVFVLLAVLPRGGCLAFGAGLAAFLAHGLWRPFLLHICVVYTSFVKSAWLYPHPI